MNRPTVENLALQVLKECAKIGWHKISSIFFVKFLYLSECEYYREHKLRLTDLKWYFHLYGPFADELRNLGGQVDLIELENKEFESGKVGKLFHIKEEELSRGKDFVDDVEVKLCVRRVVTNWLKQEERGLIDYKLMQRELLNFVYHHTEPMVIAKRGDVLDFSVILPKTTFVFPKLSKEKISKLRQEIKSQKKEALVHIYPLPEIALAWREKLTEALRKFDISEQTHIKGKKNIILKENLKDAFGAE